MRSARKTNSKSNANADELSEGLAPIIVQRIGEQLRKLGATVLIAGLDMHSRLGLASRSR